MRKLGEAAHRLVVVARVNAAELVEIKDTAAEYGLTLSAYLRSAALGRLGRRLPLIEAIERLAAANRRCGLITGRVSPHIRREVEAIQADLRAALAQVSR